MLRSGLSSTVTCSLWPAPATRARPSTSTAYAGSWRSAGLDEAALQTPPDFPLDEAAKEAFIRGGLDKQPIAMNCSGKHAAMLVTCVVQRLARGDLSRPEAPGPAGARRTPSLRRRVSRSPVGRRGRLRGAVVLGLAGRVGRARSGRSCAPTPGSLERAIVDAIVGIPGVHVRLRRGTRPRCCGRFPARSARPVPSPAMPSRCPTAARSRMKIEDGYAAGPCRRDGRGAAQAGSADLGVTDAVAATGSHAPFGGGEPVGELRPAF